LPVSTSTAPTDTRGAPFAAIRSKSTKRSRVSRSGAVSYQLAASGPGRCTLHGGGTRGRKKPFWPSSSARQASPA
jgi:hypothetical protein